MKNKLLRRLRRKAKRNIYPIVYNNKIVIIKSDYDDRYFRTDYIGWSMFFSDAEFYTENNLAKELNIARRYYIEQEIKRMRNQEIISKLEE